MKTYEPHLSNLGKISANLVAAACLIIVLVFGFWGIIIASVIFILEKNSELVRFYSAQAVLAGFCIWIFGGRGYYNSFGLFFRIIHDITRRGSWIGISTIIRLFCLLIFISSIKGVISAYRWEEWEFPILGKYARRIVLRSEKMRYSGNGTVPTDCKYEENTASNEANKNNEHGTTYQHEAKEPIELGNETKL